MSSGPSTPFEKVLSVCSDAVFPNTYFREPWKIFYFGGNHKLAPKEDGVSLRWLRSVGADIPWDNLALNFACTNQNKSDI